MKKVYIIYIIALCLFAISCGNSNISSLNFGYKKYEFNTNGVKILKFENIRADEQEVVYNLSNVEEKNLPQIEYVKINLKNIRAQCRTPNDPFRCVYIKFKGQPPVKYECSRGSGNPMYIDTNSWIAIKDDGTIFMKGCSSVKEALYSIGVTDLLKIDKINTQIKTVLFEEYEDNYIFHNGIYYIYHNSNWYIFPLKLK